MAIKPLKNLTAAWRNMKELGWHTMLEIRHAPLKTGAFFLGVLKDDMA
ncbi:MAG: hypothetical protein AAGB31_11895 [Bdellovibrio sp.]